MPGQNLMKGGPQRPYTSVMMEASAEADIKLWRKAHKKFTDALAATRAKLMKSQENNDEDYARGYLGVTTQRWRRMSSDTDVPISESHYYPSKEILLMCISEQAIDTIWKLQMFGVVISMCILIDGVGPTSK